MKCKPERQCPMMTCLCCVATICLGPQQHWTIMQQHQCIIDWGWWGLVHLGTSTADVLKEFLDCPVCFTRIWCSFNCCFSVPTTCLAQHTCCIFLFLFSVFLLVSTINISTSKTFCNAPGPCVWTPLVLHPFPQACSPQTLGYIPFLLMCSSPQTFACFPFSLPAAWPALFVPSSWSHEQKTWALKGNPAFQGPLSVSCVALGFFWTCHHIFLNVFENYSLLLMLQDIGLSARLH